MAFVTLNYLIRTGIQAPAAVFAKVADINPFSGELEMLGMKIVVNTQAIAAGGIKKIIKLQTLPEGDQRWPTSEEKRAATRGLYTLVFGARVPSLVSAEEPVVS